MHSLTDVLWYTLMFLNKVIMNVDLKTSVLNFMLIGNVFDLLKMKRVSFENLGCYSFIPNFCQFLKPYPTEIILA